MNSTDSTESIIRFLLTECHWSYSKLSSELKVSPILIQDYMANGANGSKVATALIEFIRHSKEVPSDIPSQYILNFLQGSDPLLSSTDPLDMLGEYNHHSKLIENYLNFQTNEYEQSGDALSPVQLEALQSDLKYSIFDIVTVINSQELGKPDTSRQSGHSTKHALDARADTLLKGTERGFQVHKTAMSVYKRQVLPLINQRNEFDKLCKNQARQKHNTQPIIPKEMYSRDFSVASFINSIFPGLSVHSELFRTNLSSCIERLTLQQQSVVHQLYVKLRESGDEILNISSFFSKLEGITNSVFNRTQTSRDAMLATRHRAISNCSAYLAIFRTTLHRYQVLTRMQHLKMLAETYKAINHCLNSPCMDFTTEVSRDNLFGVIKNQTHTNVSYSSIILFINSISSPNASKMEIALMSKLLHLKEAAMAKTKQRLKYLLFPTAWNDGMDHTQLNEIRTHLLVFDTMHITRLYSKYCKYIKGRVTLVIEHALECFTGQPGATNHSTSALLRTMDMTTVVSEVVPLVLSRLHGFIASVMYHSQVFTEHIDCTNEVREIVQTVEAKVCRLTDIAVKRRINEVPLRLAILLTRDIVQWTCKIHRECEPNSETNSAPGANTDYPFSCKEHSMNTLSVKYSIQLAQSALNAEFQCILTTTENFFRECSWESLRTMEALHQSILNGLCYTYTNHAEYFKSQTVFYQEYTNEITVACGSKLKLPTTLLEHLCPAPTAQTEISVELTEFMAHMLSVLTKLDEYLCAFPFLYADSIKHIVQLIECINHQIQQCVLKSENRAKSIKISAVVSIMQDYAILRAAILAWTARLECHSSLFINTHYVYDKINQSLQYFLTDLMGFTLSLFKQRTPDLIKSHEPLINSEPIDPNSAEIHIIPFFKALSQNKEIPFIINPSIVLRNRIHSYGPCLYRLKSIL